MFKLYIEIRNFHLLFTSEAKKSMDEGKQENMDEEEDNE